MRKLSAMVCGFNDAKAASKEMIKRIFTVIRGELQLEPKYIEPQLIMEFKAFLKMKGTLILT